MIRFLFGALFSFVLGSLVLDRLIMDPGIIALVTLVPYTVGWVIRRFHD